MNPMNKTTSVMHFFKTEKEKDKDRYTETGFSDNEQKDPKAQTTYQVNGRSSSQKDVNKDVPSKDLKMPNIFTKNGNLADNKLFESSQKVVRNKFGIEPDVEKVKDELLKFKQEFNKKSKELNTLKKDYFKLQVKLPRLIYRMTIIRP